MKPDAQFCISQKAFIEKDGNILVMNDPMEGLDFPGGKIQEDEAVEGDANSLKLSLKREVREETGLEIEVGRPFHVWYYEFPKGHRNYPKKVYLVGFKCKYVSGDIKISSEHDTFKWVNRDNCHTVDDGSEFYKALELCWDTGK